MGRISFISFISFSQHVQQRCFLIQYRVVQSDMISKITALVRIEAPLLREVFAEFLGTFILVIFGDAAVAQSKLSDSKNGDFLSINWGWGIGLIMGVLVSGGVSGAHLNPAVSLAFAVVGKFPFKKVLFYWLAQYLGIFATYPAAWLSIQGGMGDQVLSNFTLSVNSYV